MEEIYQALKENDFKFTTDTRQSVEGLAYFAIKGENFDGNDFVEDALEKGASFAVTNRPELAENNPKIFFTEDTEILLGEMAHHHRSLFEIPVIALTGSNGKTTTKEFLRVVLSKKHNVVATKGNLNNHLGVPYTLLSITPETDIVIIEMGASHIGEIARLCKIADPTHGLITNIGRAHLGEFGGVEEIIIAKGELYDYLKKTGGDVFVDEQDEVLLRMINNRNLETIPYIENLEISLKLFGSYNLQNARAAYTVGNYFGVLEKDIREALESYEPASDRSRVLVTEKGNRVIADMYNANPSSVSLSIREFLATNPEEKIVVLGDMLELGEYSAKEHQKIVDDLQRLHAKHVYLVGSEFQKTDSLYQTFANTQDCVAALKEKGYSDKDIFIKGSRGIALEEILKEEII